MQIILKVRLRMSRQITVPIYRIIFNLLNLNSGNLLNFFHLSMIVFTVQHAQHCFESIFDLYAIRYHYYRWYMYIMRYATQHTIPKRVCFLPRISFSQFNIFLSFYHSSSTQLFLVFSSDAKLWMMMHCSYQFYFCWTRHLNLFSFG